MKTHGSPLTQGLRASQLCFAFPVTRGSNSFDVGLPIVTALPHRETRVKDSEAHLTAARALNTVTRPCRLRRPVIPDTKDCLHT